MDIIPVPPQLNEEVIAKKLRLLRKKMSILEMQRVSGVDRQVLYRLMGGSSINRTPYELVVKLLAFLNTLEESTVVTKELPIHEPEVKKEEIDQKSITVSETDLPTLSNISVLE